MAVPMLRFKEFDGAWSETLFQDLFIFKNGVNASKEQYGSGIKFINVLDIINNPNGITYDSIIGSVNITSKEIDKNLVKYGDVLFQRSSETREEVGQSNVYLGKDPVVFGGFVIRGSAQKEYDPIFMNGLLKTDSLRDQITQLSGGSTRFNIGQDSLNKVSAYLPLKEEQTKIASFLSAVDEKISQLTQKHELLSQYKQGMMQKLFSQQIRFKADDGSEFGEWEVIQANQIFENYSNKNHDGTLTILAATQDKGVVPRDEIDIDIKSSDASVLSYKIIEKGNFVISLRSFQGGIEYSNYHGICSPAYTILKSIKPIASGFYKNYLKTNDFIQRLSATVIGIRDGKQISYQAFSTLMIDYPSVEEQTKIANFLSSIDQKIDVVAQQIEQAKTWKKGLLQQMFV